MKGRCHVGSLVDADRVRELLDFDPTTGLLFRRKTGQVASRAYGRGYACVFVDGRSYLAHRLIWLYINGEWPTGYIDHTNGNPADNRIDNLRVATPSQNIANSRACRNTYSGLKGVTRSRSGKRWRARLKKNGRWISLGHYSTPESAHAAYFAAAREHFGEFARGA